MAEEDQSHKWVLTNLSKAYVCEECGVLKLVTINGYSYFVRFSLEDQQKDAKCEEVK